MGLFGNNKKQPLPDLMTPADYEDVASYTSALNYLIGLSGDDYTKVTQIAAIHRQANYDSAQVLGEELEPTTFINPPEPETEPLPEPNFLDDDEVVKKPKSKKIEVSE